MKISEQCILKYKSMHHASGEKRELNEEFLVAFPKYTDPRALSMIIKGNRENYMPKIVAWIEESVDLYYGIYEKTKGQMLDKIVEEAAVFG